MMKAPTITDLAICAGVSVSTVSKALSGKGRMSADTRTRIIQMANDMGYKPNPVAQSLPRKTARCFAAIIPDYPNEVQSLIYNGLQDAFANYTPFNISSEIIRISERGGADELKQSLKSLAGKIDALILQCDLWDDDLSEFINRDYSGIPIVTLVTNSKPYNAITSVLIDAESVGRLAAQVFSLCNAKDTIILAGRKGAYIHERNIAGYLEAAEEYKLSLNGVYYTDDNWEKAYAETEAALREHPNLDGIFVSSYLAPSVCNCLRDHNLASKIKVIGVDLYEQTAGCLQDHSLLATIYQNQYLQAHTAVDVMMHCVSNRTQILPPVRMKPELVLLSNLKGYQEKLPLVDVNMQKKPSLETQDL